MENTENTFTETNPTPVPQSKWFHNSWISKSTLVLAGLLFLLPFININCSGNKLASIKGTDMVFGNQLKPEIKNPEVKDSEVALPASADSTAKEMLGDLGDSLEAGFGSLMKNDNPFEMDGAKNKNIEPNLLAIVAFASIFLALIFSFFKKRAASIFSGIFSLLSVLTLFFIQVQIGSEIEKQMGPMNFVPITFEFTSFYWLCLLFLTIATIFSFVRSSLKAA